MEFTVYSNEQQFKLRIMQLQIIEDSKWKKSNLNKLEAASDRL